MDRVWREGGWTIYFDESYYVEHELGLGRSVVKLLTQGRSKRITVVLGMQRPAWISRFALSEPTHFLAARLGDKRDVKTVSEIAGDQYAESLQDLDRYEFSYLNKNTGEVVTGIDRDNVKSQLTV